MKILKATKTTATIVVTKKELDAITTALYEWQEVEDHTMNPARQFEKTHDAFIKAVVKFKQGQLELMQSIQSKWLENQKKVK